MPPSQLRVLLVDDHRVFTESLALTLDLEPDLHCVAFAHTVRDGLAKAAAYPFDVAVVDLDLPDGDGLDLVARLPALRPGARVVVLTAHPRAALAGRAVAAGAAAFLPKDASLARILSAVRTADPARPVVEAVAAGQVVLTPREHDVLRHLGRGHDASRTAAALGMSVHTCRDHIKSLMAKLGARSQLEAVVAAGRLGLITIGSRY